MENWVRLHESGDCPLTNAWNKRVDLFFYHMLPQLLCLLHWVPAVWSLKSCFGICTFNWYSNVQFFVLFRIPPSFITNWSPDLLDQNRFRTWTKTWTLTNKIGQNHYLTDTRSVLFKLTIVVECNTLAFRDFSGWEVLWNISLTYWSCSIQIHFLQ